MTSLVFIRRNKFGRAPTRGKSYARPLSSGMEISYFIRHAGRWLPSLRVLGAVIFSRVTEPGGWQTTTRHRVPLRFVRAVLVARHLFPSLFIRSTLQAGKQTAGCVSKALHLTLSAGSTGLVAAPDGHRGSERKFGNVRKSSGEIRNVER